MKIGIDVQATEGKLTGLGVYTQNLVRTLMEEKRNGFEFSLFSETQEGDWNTWQRLVWENSTLPSRARKERVEILHVPAFSPPWAKPCRLVVTVHDLIGMTFPNQLGLPSRLYWGKWLPRAVKRADAIIADSENSKRDILRLLDVMESKIRVIYPSGHEGFYPEKDPAKLAAAKKRLGIHKSYFLAVGTVEPRKNIARIIEAFLRFIQKENCSDYQLVLVGLTHFAHGAFLKSILQDNREEKNILLAGYVEKGELNALYSGAAAFLFPSLYEGFGIPVLEAMAAGTPVLTSRASSLPEVAGEAAYYVDAYDTESIALGIKKMYESKDSQKEYSLKGLVQAKRFSWKKTAGGTINAYES